MEFNPPFEPENVKEAVKFLEKEIEQPQFTSIWESVASGMAKEGHKAVDKVMRKSAQGLLVQL